MREPLLKHQKAKSKTTKNSIWGQRVTYMRKLEIGSFFLSPPDLVFKLVVYAFDESESSFTKSDAKFAVECLPSTHSQYQARKKVSGRKTFKDDRGREIIPIPCRGHLHGSKVGTSVKVYLNKHWTKKKGNMMVGPRANRTLFLHGVRWRMLGRLG